MPRQPRLDIPYVLHHVIVRGIERRGIFADGTAADRREDLIGDGLKRSLIGQEESSERTAYDERIFGSGEFVESLTHDDNLSESLKLQLPLAELRQRVCDVTGIKAEKLQRPGKERVVDRARALFCYLAIQEFGYHGKGAGLMVNLGPVGVCNAIRRGELLLESDPALREKIVGGQKLAN